MEASRQNRDSLAVLLGFAELGKAATIAFRNASEGRTVTDNVSLIVLCRLELEGPMRPSDIVRLTNLTSGGVTKVISRLEDAGLVTRDRKAFSDDKRGVAVSLTEEGHALTLRFAAEFADQSARAATLIEDMRRLLDR